LLPYFIDLFKSEATQTQISIFIWIEYGHNWIEYGQIY